MNEEKITIWEERIHACQNSDLTVAAWCREHQISVATYYYCVSGFLPMMKYFL